MPLDGAPVPGNGVALPEHVEVLVVVGADGAFELVEDDESALAVTRMPDAGVAVAVAGGRADGVGLGTAAADDGRAPEARTRIVHEQVQGRVVVGPATGAVGVVPAARRWTLTFLALADDDRVPVVTVDGEPADTVVERDARGLHVTVEGVAATSRLAVEVGPDPRLAPNDVPGRVFAALDRARIAYDDKERAHRVLTTDRPLTVRLSHLQALGLPPVLEAALTEILLAHAPGTGLSRGEAPADVSEAVRPV